MIANLHFVKQLGRDIKEALEAGQLEAVRRADEHPLGVQEGAVDVDEQRPDQPLVRAGDGQRCPGGKLIGAGGGGFLMFLCEERARVRQVLAEEGLEEVRFRFDFEGTKVILQ